MKTHATYVLCLFNRRPTFGNGKIKDAYFWFSRLALDTIQRHEKPSLKHH